MTGMPFSDNPLQNMRYAARMLLRSPGFAITAILALWIGSEHGFPTDAKVGNTLLKSRPPKLGERKFRLQRVIWLSDNPSI